MLISRSTGKYFYVEHRFFLRLLNIKKVIKVVFFLETDRHSTKRDYHSSKGVPSAMISGSVRAHDAKKSVYVYIKKNKLDYRCGTPYIKRSP